ncbi:MAG: hypothetical protein HQ575_07350 [Candidatus Omnitrophica bacterium]|nr:hypothetical protein [Candidatus Omnitrophota bacterium]
MRKFVSFLFIALYLISCPPGYCEDAPVWELEGIEAGMKENILIEHWGHPSKRELRGKVEVWIYVKENTPHPTDGIIVYLERKRVKSYEEVENVYSEMRIWGTPAGKK